MKTDTTVTTDEARQLAQHEEIKSHVEHGVNKEIERRTDRPDANEAPRLESVARDLRGGAIDEAAEKDREVKRARGLARGSGFIDYAFYLIYGLLTIRLALAMLGARSSNGFVQLIQTITDPFYAMFKGIVPSPTIDGGFTLVVPIIIAIAVYALLHAAINGFLRMIANRKTEI